MEIASLIILIIITVAGLISAIVALIVLKKTKQIARKYENVLSVKNNEGTAVGVNKGVINVEEGRKNSGGR